MLVLSRKKGESVVIENKILTVIEIQPDQVSLQVECPEEYSIQLAESSEWVNRGGHSPAFICVRRKNESFVINRDITVTLVEIRDDKIRLGFVVPKECAIHRKEVFDALHGKAQ